MPETMLTADHIKQIMGDLSLSQQHQAIADFLNYLAATLNLKPGDLVVGLGAATMTVRPKVPRNNLQNACINPIESTESP